MRTIEYEKNIQRFVYFFSKFVLEVIILHYYKFFFSLFVVCYILFNCIRKKRTLKTHISFKIHRNKTKLIVKKKIFFSSFSISLLRIFPFLLTPFRLLFRMIMIQMNKINKKNTKQKNIRTFECV